MRSERTFSESEIAEKAGFHTEEGMYHWLESWGFTSLLPPENQENTTKPQSPSPKPERKARKLGPARQLPSAGNAIELYKERIEALLKDVEVLEHMDQTLHGRYFARQEVETADVHFRWDDLSEKGREAIRELHGRDGDYWDPSATIKLPGGVALSPSEPEAMLIGVYALAGGDMDRLLDALHLDSSSVGAETREEIRQCIEGSRPDDKKDGLKVLAHQLATWVRGSEVRPGRPSGRSKADHAFACAITHYRKQGLSDEEIARKESHRKKEDGTSYTIKDIAELGDLGLSWP
jgi:hypothetical protein